jgi:hypothetical protein
MTKKLMLELPEDVHATLKEYQIDRQTADRRKTFLNDLLVEIIQTSKPINDTARGILERAARKGE